MPTGKAKKPAQAGKKEEKGEAKKPLQEKKPENAPAKAKKEGAPKQGSAPSKKKDPATKPAAGGEGGKAKDKGKKRKLNETAQGKSKQGAPTSESKKKKVEKKVQGKSPQKGRVAKKPTKKSLSKPKPVRRSLRRRRPARRGKQELVVYEGRRYFLLPSGKMKAVLDIKLEENDKIAKVEGAFIKKSDVKAFEEYKASIKSEPATAVKRKLRLKLQILRRALIKDMLKEAKGTNKLSLATAKDAGREVKAMTMFRGTWVRKNAVPRLKLFVRNKTIKIKAARKEKGPKELTEAEQKTLARYTRKILHEEGRRLRHALLSKRPSVAGKQKPTKKTKKPAKKPAPAKAKAAPSKPAADTKKQKRPAKKAAN